MPTADEGLEAEGQPQLYDPPPGQDIDLDQDGPVVPGDRPRGTTDYGITSAEERTDEPLARRVLREVPEVGDGELDGDESPLAPRLLDPDSDIDELDVTAEAYALEAEDDSAGLTAEEAAMHIVSEDDASATSPLQERAEYLERPMGKE